MLARPFLTHTSAVPARRGFRSAFLASAAFLALSACASIDTAPIQQPEEVKREAINLLDHPPVITIESEPDEFWSVQYDRGNPLPTIPVGPIVAKDVSVSTMLELLAENAKLAVITDPKLSEARITFSDPNARPLADVVQSVADRSGIFYEYKDHTLIFESSREFNVRIPRMETGEDDNSLSMFEEAIKHLGGTEVYTNKVTGSIFFKANYRTYRAIQAFMKTFEQGRDMMVYEGYVFEVTLSDSKAAGIDWKKLGLSVGGMDLTIGGPAQTVSSGLTMGVIGTPGPFSLDILLNLLDKQGATDTLARPTISVISGGSSEFSVGEKQQYIEKVQTTTTNSSNNNDNINSNNFTESVDVQTLETGIKVKIKGSHTNGIIFTNLELTIDNLLEFQEFETGETKLRLPHTTNRLLKTSLEARPGDLLVLGGLIQERKESGTDKVVGTNVPFAKSASTVKSEMVILLRPRLVRIRPADREVRLVPSPDERIMRLNERPQPAVAPMPLIVPSSPKEIDLLLDGMGSETLKAGDPLDQALLGETVPPTNKKSPANNPVLLTGSKDHQ